MGFSEILKKLKNFRLLPPKDREFYELFNEMAATAVETSELLVMLFNKPRQERSEVETQIALRLTRGAQIADLLEELVRSAQQPPFERSEISDFSDNMIRIIKYINHASNRYIVYDFPSSDKEMREMAPMIREACQEICKAVKMLNRNRTLDPFYKAVDRLESQADEIYHGGLRRRFQEIRQDHNDLDDMINQVPDNPSGQDLLPIISSNVEYTRHVAVFFALRQVYAELERAIDACTDLSATIKRMVSKNV
jgi:uncharacterized protein